MSSEPIVVTESEPIVTPAQAEELIEKFEGATRQVPGKLGLFVSVLAVGMALYALYVALATVEPQFFRSIHLLFALVLVFLFYPARKNGEAWRTRIGISDWLLALLSIAAIGYLLLDYEKFIYRAAVPLARDIAFGLLLILLILEAVRRAVGWHLAALVAIFLLYSLIGPKGLIPFSLPEPFGHRGYDVDRLVGHSYMTLEGIFGVPLDVSATFIILFTIYGAILDFSGAGKFFVDLSFALFGKRTTGAGRAVTFASFLLGGPSGSGVATTVTLGSIAYPMLKKAGYDKENAGGILSAGGIGAVLSPPVLGAASFLIAEFLKISYLQVIAMSLVPTLLYYVSIFLMVELDAHRFGIREVKIEAPPVRVLLLKYGYHLTSLFTIVIFMLGGFTAILSVFWASVIAFFLSFLRAESRLTPSRLFRALEAGAKQVLAIAATTAAAGIIIGIFSLTGLGLKLSGIIIDLAALTPLPGTQLFFTLVFTALAVWLLGLALPITASYIVAAVLAGPALVKIGVPDFAAHMFIFYYAILSEVSPPVGLSPFAAAAITGGNPYKTMMMAWKYTLPAFVVPFMFTLAPAGVGLLLRGSVENIIFTTVTAIIGITALTTGVGGWLLVRAQWWERIGLVVAGLLLIYPEQNLDLIGIALFAAIFLWQWFNRRRTRAAMV